MSAGPLPATVLFEPWSLGDVVIAASVLRELSAPVALACHPQWHALVRGALPERSELDLIAVKLPYTTRTRSSPFDSAGRQETLARTDITQVLSIRGDARDYAAARKAFPRARIRMNGWIRFWGRKSALVNAPYALGLLRPQNRYQSWASLADIPFERIEQNYRQSQSCALSSGPVVIHLGAQWRSKQYPHVAALRDRLRELGRQVSLVAGPGDLLPAGINEAEVARIADQQLIAALRSATHVITNDSGPMHLAALLGCRTIAVARTSPIEEWLPPATIVVRSPATPRGYRPHRRYMSDETLSDWPSIKTVINAFPADRR